MDKKTYNVVIVDDHPVVIEGLKHLLSGIEFIKITDTFTTEKGIMDYKGLPKTDIIFLDIFLKTSNGIDICLKLKKKYPHLIILAMSSQYERSIITQAMQNGANGYLSKSATITEYKQCLLDAIAGNTAFCNQVAQIIDKYPANDAVSIQKLTLREKEILELLREGKSTQEISDQLYLSFLTVQTHRRNLLHKYQAKNIVELLNIVKANGLIY